MRAETFRYVLHPVDLALNKVMAAAGRREVRDLVGLVMMQWSHIPSSTLGYPYSNRSI